MNTGSDHGEPVDPSTRPTTRDFSHSPVSARVPEAVGRGCVATGTIILQSGDDFVIDFINNLAPPAQVVARVILTLANVGPLVTALRKNMAAFEDSFGSLLPRHPMTRTAPPREHEPAMPSPPAAPAVPAAPAEPASPRPAGPHTLGPDLQELYEQVRLADEVAAGAYANVVLIRHSNEEFCFDFIVNFYPRPIVTSRVLMAAGRIPGFVDALCASLQRHRQGSQQRPIQ